MCGGGILSQLEISKSGFIWKFWIITLKLEENFRPLNRNKLFQSNLDYQIGGTPHQPPRHMHSPCACNRKIGHRCRWVMCNKSAYSGIGIVWTPTRARDGVWEHIFDLLCASWHVHMASQHTKRAARTVLIKHTLQTVNHTGQHAQSISNRCQCISSNIYTIQLVQILG